MTEERETTVIVRTVARLVFPMILVTAVALLLQGHNRPGGGFIAGVLTVAAVALVYIIFGLDYFEEQLFDRSLAPFAREDVGVHREFGTVFTLGLAIAAAGGIVAIFLGEPFLTQAVVFLDGIPLYGKLEVASALVFDLGVYFVVVGALLTVLAVVGAE